jgi:hypothetical protein
MISIVYSIEKSNIVIKTGELLNLKNNEFTKVNAAIERIIL